MISRVERDLGKDRYIDDTGLKALATRVEEILRTRKGRICDDEKLGKISRSYATLPISLDLVIELSGLNLIDHQRDLYLVQHVRLARTKIGVIAPFFKGQEILSLRIL